MWDISPMFRVVSFALFSNRCFQLVIINNCRLVGAFKIFIFEGSEPMNNALSYGTILINGTYCLFCSLYSVFFLSGSKT